MIRECPGILPDSITKVLDKLADEWATSAIRPKLDKEVTKNWDNLIKSWTNDETLPLFIRRPNLGRGSVIKHETGRDLVPVDNTPAHWVFNMADEYGHMTIEELFNKVNDRDVPVAMVLSIEERRNNLFKTGNPRIMLSSKGWQVCHKKPVKLGPNGDVKNIPINILKEHFVRLMIPSNIFLVPKQLGALGELPQFTNRMMDID
jgi:hypothetical protein